MSIREFFMDIDELAHQVDRAIHDMEGIGDASAEGGNGMDQLLAVDLSVGGSSVI